MPSTYVELKNSSHHLPAGSKVLRPTNPNKWIKLTLALRPRSPLPDLSSLNMVKPAQRKYMTRDQLTQRHGSDPDAVKRIESFAKAHNLVVTRNDPTSARIGIAGTAARLSAAFGVKLFDYSHPTLGQFHARTGPIHVPQEIANDIIGVFGFNNHRIMHRRSLRSLHPADRSHQCRPWFIPSELAPIYDFPNANANGQCVGLLEFGGGVSTDDVIAYFGHIGLAAPPITVVAVDGVSTDPTADPDSTGEVMLDIDVAGCLGAGAKLAVYFSTFDEKGLVDILSAVIADAQNDPSVVSISWGWAENEPFNNSGITWSDAAIAVCEQSFLAAAQLGITVCVSTGDDGSEAQIQDGRAHVNFPASSEYVLAVGGTTLHVPKDATGASTRTEVVWNDGPGSGTGGGISESVKVPQWQEGIVPPSINPGAFSGRAIPDVAADADPNTGYYTRAGGKFSVVGGTSASAPLWASLIARINANNGARTGNFNALLYSQIGPAKVLNDIVSGNNDTDGLLAGQYPAGPGWDACTGWGSPGGTQLQAALK
jgi:kumamolisin